MLVEGFTSFACGRVQRFALGAWGAGLEIFLIRFWDIFLSFGCLGFLMWNVERLEVYSKICDLIPKVYALIKMLPAEEKFALGDQMRRAVVSVKLNFIEGSGKRTSREFVSYLNNSMGSLREIRGCVGIGVDLEYFCEEGEIEIADIKRIERLLGGYIEYVKKRNVL